ncbi:MAG: aldo/keto reductase [bacterium]|nr:aldo/keto reductase [bacterium]
MAKRLTAGMLILMLLLAVVGCSAPGACSGQEEKPDTARSAEEASDSMGENDARREDSEKTADVTGKRETESRMEEPEMTDNVKDTPETAPTVTLNSGYEMPVLGLGTYSLTGETCVESVYTAIQNGYRLVDTAYMYRNETEVGEAVRKAVEDGLITREEMFVTTKLYPNQYSDPEAAIEEALEKLDLGYIDLMLLHHPGDGDVEAYQAIEKYIEEGKIRSAGLSNWYVEELTDFLPQVDMAPALVQNEIHPYYQEQEVVPFIQGKDIVVEGWYPLGGRGYQKELLSDPVLQEIADSHGKSVAQVILRWNIQRDVIAIPGSSNPDHIAENIDIFDFELTDEEMDRIAALERNEKHDWY